MRALRRFVDRHRPNPAPDSLVFTEVNGGPFTGYLLPKRLRAHLKAIGLGRERPELFATTADRLQIRVHDLRGTFVTVSLANGKTESWISDRTGHRSSQMIYKYKRAARMVEQLALGDFVPLDEAIPELRPLAPVIPIGGPQGGPEVVGQDRLELSANGLRVVTG